MWRGRGSAIRAVGLLLLCPIWALLTHLYSLYSPQVTLTYTAYTCPHLTTPVHTFPHLLTTTHTCSQLPTPSHTCSHLPTTSHTCSHMIIPAHICPHLPTPAHTCQHLPTCPPVPPAPVPCPLAEDSRGAGSGRSPAGPAAGSLPQVNSTLHYSTLDCTEF